MVRHTIQDSLEAICPVTNHPEWILLRPGSGQCYSGSRKACPSRFLFFFCFFFPSSFLKTNRHVQFKNGHLARGDTPGAEETGSFFHEYHMRVEGTQRQVGQSRGGSQTGPLWLSLPVILSMIIEYMIPTKHAS